MNKRYIPKKGDLFQWCDEDYWCVKTGEYSGVVNPVGDSICVRGFVWNYGGEELVFIKKANKEEMKKIEAMTSWT